MYHAREPKLSHCRSATLMDKNHAVLFCNQFKIGIIGKSLWYKRNKTHPHSHALICWLCYASVVFYSWLNRSRFLLYRFFQPLGILRRFFFFANVTMNFNSVSSLTSSALISRPLPERFPGCSVKCLRISLCLPICPFSPYWLITTDYTQRCYPLWDRSKVRQD